MKFNNKYCIEYHDIYNLSTRIKKINKYYKLFYSKIDKRFMIVNTANNYEICLNFDNFNQNIENKLKFTNVSNFKNIIEFIDENNLKLANKQENSTTEKVVDACAECVNFSKKASNISYEDINKIVGECNV